MAGGGVFAQTTEHKHCVCGAEHKEIGNHKTEDADASKIFQAWESDSTLPGTKGRYYLTKDVVISETWQPADGTVLCLNGKTISMNAAKDAISVGKGETFILTDCKEAQGSITHRINSEATTYAGRGMSVAGTFTMYGGNITGSNLECNSNEVRCVFGSGKRRQ